MLVFEKKFDLPCFASFTALIDEKKRPVIEEWQKTFFNNASKFNAGYWMDTKSWRANPDYGKKIGVDLDAVWKTCIETSLEFRAKYETPETPIVISGVVGPRRDGYKLDKTIELTVDDARDYHRAQLEAFKRYGADVITVYTMNHFEEAAGIVLACKELGMPLVVSFTVETDGKLASGESLAAVVKRVDAISDKYPLFYMINCAHPSHMEGALKQLDGETIPRLKGFFPNSSRKSHAELDESTELDRGEPDKIGEQLFGLLVSYGVKPSLVGGCCGTGSDHICSISTAYTQM